MLVVPADRPVTIPVVPVTVATVDAELDHVPPLMLLASVVNAPGHILSVPVIAAAGFTVIVLCENAISPHASVAVTV